MFIKLKPCTTLIVGQRRFFKIRGDSIYTSEFMEEPKLEAKRSVHAQYKYIARKETQEVLAHHNTLEILTILHVKTKPFVSKA